MSLELVKKNRQAATALFLDEIDELMLDDGANRRMYEEFLKTLDDQAFLEWITQLNSGERWVKVVAPWKGPSRMTAKNNVKLARKWGKEIYQKLIIPADPVAGTPAYITPILYFTGWLPTRRQSQLHIKKESTADGVGTFDLITGQAAGKDDAGRISSPELQVLAARGQTRSLYEFMTLRGGDKGGFNALNNTLMQKGYVYSESLTPYRTGVESTHSLYAYLTACHLRNNLMSNDELG